MNRRTGMAAVIVVASLGLGAAAEEVEHLEMDSIGEVHVRMLSEAGAAAVAHIITAREKIAAGQSGAAVHHVGRARQILLEARGISPALTLRDRIADALGVIRADPDPNALLPIYAQIDAYSDAEDVMEVRAGVDGARAALGAGDPDAAVDHLYVAMSEIDYLEVDLPIHEALSHVDRALLLLHRHNTTAADFALGQALGRIEVIQGVATRETLEADEGSP